MSTVTVSVDGMTERKRGRPAGQGTRPIRIAEPLAKVLDQMASDKFMSATMEANRLIREGLEREGRWPPQPPKGRK
jgi:hypothetical protein